MSNKNLTIEYYGESNLGLIRSENQDSFGKFPAGSDDLNNTKGLLFIIADGMGGHIGGKEASQAAIDIINKEYFEYASNDISDCLRYAFKTANFKINQSSEKDLQYQKKGTTCSALVLENNFAYIAHVGDSRIYKISGNKIEQLTIDHTQVGEMFRKGILSKDEAEKHPAKSVLVRALGIETEVEVDISGKIPVMPGEKFLLCSDGLAKVSKDEILEVVTSGSPSEACKELIRLANEKGGHDNVTVQIVNLNENEKQSIAAEDYSPAKAAGNWFKFSIITFIAAGIILAVVMFQKNIKNFFSQDAPDSDNTTIDNNIPETDKFETFLTRANNYLSEGELDSAMTFYNLILSGYPMHMGALSGIEKVAERFIKEGNVLVNQKNYEAALIVYRKAHKIRNEDRKLYNLILLCEKELQKQSSERLKTSDIAEAKTEATTKNVIDVPKNVSPDESSLYPNDFSGWSFEQVSKSDYEFSENKITFLNTDKTKKIIYDQPMEDIDVRVNLMLNTVGEFSRAGIIVGYKNDPGNESYFLFSTDNSGNFILDKFFDNKSQRLLSINKPVETGNGSFIYNLKVKCLGPWIMIYSNNKLLDSWLNEDFILGKIGLFADTKSHAEFSDIKITTAFESQEKQ